MEEFSKRRSSESVFSRLKSTRGGFLQHTSSHRHHHHVLPSHSKFLHAFRSLLHLLRPRPGQKYWRSACPPGAPHLNDDCSLHVSSSTSLFAPSSNSTSGVAKGHIVVTGTLYGRRKGRIHFAVQEDPKATPMLLLELATPTNTLVKEMASGLVKIALECNSALVPSADHVFSSTKNRRSLSTSIDQQQQQQHLFQEPSWTMYCNGRKTGFANLRTCSAADLHILSLVKAVSMGAGILPVQPQQQDDKLSGCEGEILYMRASFERVIGSKDSEVFYMMNPDGNGGPELSIFLLRIT